MVFAESFAALDDPGQAPGGPGNGDGDISCESIGGRGQRPVGS